jgi:uncharacterized DUF497 family protein
MCRMLTFEWDIGKAGQNLVRHRVSFDEALTVFADPLARFLDDEGHSFTEDRFILLGRSSAGSLLAVMFTDRGAERIRIISTRRATRRERRQYEQEAG